MTTARTVLQNALTFHLNRLSPGEAADADVLDTCLRALNDVADEWNGVKSFLFREILTVSTPITGVSGTLGVDWAGLVSGDEIIGATCQYQTGLDVPLDPLTMQQYAQIAIKTVSSLPAYYAHDGAATVYFYPAVPAKTITLQTRQVVSSFADLDTDYVMPKGYSSALSACVADRLAPVMNAAVAATVKAAARAAKNRIFDQAVNPAIINGSTNPGPVARIKRGY